jgi:hypothetical protein
MSALLAGLGLAAGRLRAASTAGAILVGAAFAAVVGLLERRYAPAGAPDRALDASFRWLVPLVCLGVTARALGARRLDEALWSLARFGAPRRPLALGVVAGAALGAAAGALVIVALALATSHSTAAAFGQDLGTTAWVTALGASAYVAWLALGAALGRHGPWGIWLADLTLGGGTSALAVPWPRAHLRNLLGGDAPFDLSQPASTVALAVMAAAVTALALSRLED